MDEPSPISLPSLKVEVSNTWRGCGFQVRDLLQAGSVGLCMMVTGFFLILAVTKALCVSFFQYRNGVWVCLLMGRDLTVVLSLFHCQCRDNIDSFI